MSVTLATLRQFLESGSSDRVDLSFVEPARGKTLATRLLSADAAQTLEVFGKHGSGSLLAVWKSTGGKTPIVWLDSQGSPNGVVADSAEQLACLLPYDTGLMCELLGRCLNHVTAPRKYPKPTDKKYDWAERLEQARQSHPQVGELREWLEEQKLKVDPDPSQTVWAAFSSHARLDAWLVEKKLRAPHAC